MRVIRFVGTVRDDGGMELTFTDVFEIHRWLEVRFAESRYGISSGPTLL